MTQKIGHLQITKSIEKEAKKNAKLAAVKNYYQQDLKWVLEKSTSKVEKTIAGRSLKDIKVNFLIFKTT